MSGQASIVKATLNGVVSGVTSVVRLEPFRGALDHGLKTPCECSLDHAFMLLHATTQCAFEMRRPMRAVASLVKLCTSCRA